MRLRSGLQSYSCLPYFFSPPPPTFKYRHRIRYSPVRWCLPQLDGVVKNTCYQTCHFMCQLPPSTGRGEAILNAGLMDPMVLAFSLHIGSARACVLNSCYPALCVASVLALTRRWGEISIRTQNSLAVAPPCLASIRRGEEPLAAPFSVLHEVHVSVTFGSSHSTF